MPLDKFHLQDHQNFLTANLQTLLAEGWRGYQESGRGAVIIDDRHSDDPDLPWQQRSIKISYYPNQMAVSSNSGWPTRDIKKLVREYNPLKQVICVFLLPDNLCAGYKTWSKDFTPQQAAAVLSADSTRPPSA